MQYHLSKVTKRYGPKTVLDIGNLEIERGSLHALLGPNGSGKTTLLKILSFLEPPTTGQIDFHSKRVEFTQSRMQLLRQDVVMVNQHPILFTTSVRKNLEFGLNIRKVPKKIRSKKVEEALEMVNLRSLAQAPAHKLSGGETKRVALARALVLSPQVILCDEPTAGVDAENQATIAALLKSINQDRRVTLVIATHDLEQAVFLTDRRIVLDRGKVAGERHENQFMATIHTGESGDIVCSIQSFLNIPMDTIHRGQTRVAISPERIKIRRLPPPSSPDEIRWRVDQLATLGDRVRVTLASQIQLQVIMDMRAFESSGLGLGERVTMTIPPDAIQILP